jgi:hypothetical protein
MLHAEPGKQTVLDRLLDVLVLDGEPLDQQGHLDTDRRPPHLVRVGPLPGDQDLPQRLGCGAPPVSRAGVAG